MPKPSGVPSQEPSGVPSQKPESQPTSLEDNRPSASAAHGRSRPKKIFIPVVLFALGVLLALVAFIVVYPQPETGIPTPPYSKIEILTSVPISSVVVNVAQITSTKARMYVVVNLPQGTSAPPARADEEIAVVLPFGTTSFDCRLMTSNYCKNNTGSVQSSADEPLTFRSATVAGISIVKADSNFIVNARDFGVNFNGINAYAAIPEVNLQLTSAGAESPLMSVQFHIPSAATYDWSSFPTSELEGSVVRWQEQLAPDDTPERTTVGINYARQTRDANLNFLAGALVGVAGAAILSAIQETLHISD